MKVAEVGATGMVGEVMLQVLVVLLLFWGVRLSVIMRGILEMVLSPQLMLLEI